MILKSKPLFILMLAIALLASCKKNDVNLSTTNFSEEIPSLGNLIFTFDKSLVPDSILNQWDFTVYIEFEPKIEGKFRWESGGVLVFSPMHDLPPSTNFKAKITKEILNYSDYTLGKVEIPIFHTPLLQIENINGMWVSKEENTTKVSPQIDLYFNYKVDPAKLKSLIKIAIGNDSKDFVISNTTPDQKISLLLTGITPEDKDLSVDIVIEKGMLPVNGNSPSDKNFKQNVIIPSPFLIYFTNIEAEHDGITGVVKLFSSQKINSENINSFISFSPSVTFTAQPTDDGIEIRSEKFDVSKPYQIIIKQGLKGNIGGTLKEDYANNITFGQLQPAIAFVNKKGVYLSGKGARNLEILITSIPKITVTISKIYENNLLAAQKYGYNERSEEYYGGGYYYEDENYNFYNNDLQLGDIIYTKEIETKNLPRNGNSKLFKFDFADQLKEFEGIYYIKIQSDDDYWMSDYRYISLSDIGLIAKEGKDKIFVFANSIKSANALPGVDVNAYGSNNQLIGSGKTNKDGVAEIKINKKDFAGFKPAMVTAKDGKDFNFMPFYTTRVNTSRFEVDGKYSNETNLDAFIYGDRDIYRPGEKVNLSVIIRNQKWKIPGEIPVKLKFLLPNGKELKSLLKTLNNQGSLETQIDLSTSAITGDYIFQVFTSNDILIAQKSILVEEFMPDRIKVSATLDKPFLKPTDKETLKITAINFFGPPASNRNWECEIQVNRKIFSPKKYERYDFSIANNETNFEKVNLQGVTDINGNAEASYIVPPNYANNGILQASFYTTVFDETGRPVNKKNDADIFTQDAFFGIASDGYNYYALNQNINFQLIAVDKNEKPLSNVKAHVVVIKHEYKTVLSKYDDSYFRYESQKDDRVIADKEIILSGENTQFGFVPKTPGEYEIRVAKPGTNSYVKSWFYSYGRWGSDNNSFAVNNEGNIDIETDKESYLVGEKAKILFKTPFNGKLLITFEIENVTSYQYVNVENRTASIDIDLKDGYLPNAYISATLFKPHEESDLPLTAAHGYKSIAVEEKVRKIKVEIIAEKSARSKTKQKVIVKSTPGSKVTLAAVDEGILQVTGMQTPDPYNFYYAKRALEVNSFDLYPLLFPEIKSKLSSTGGDGFDLGKRVNPMQNKRVKLVSYWSGIVDAKTGETTFEFEVPQFSGQLRLMAVAHKDNSFGSAENFLTVADPIVISTAMPRFLSPKDTLTMPITVTNTTAQNKSSVVTIKTEGNLTILGSASQKIELKPNSEARPEFKIVATKITDAGKVIVEVNSNGEKFIDETNISVRPPASLQKITGSGIVSANTSQTITIESSKFLAGTESGNFTISKSPLAEFTARLQHLVEYPYGCSEQTISAAFPQLYYSDFAEAMNFRVNNAKANANFNVQEAIRKLKMRQLYSGGITLWDNDYNNENWWTSIYAAHFLYEAKKAGFEVEESFTNSLHNYIIGKLKDKKTVAYFFNQNQKKQIAPREIAYSLYVLAMVGKNQNATMNYYKQNSNLLAMDSKYLLSAAYALAGDKMKFKELLPTSFNGEISAYETGGSFSSPVRDEAIALNALLQVDPNNAQITTMAKHISQYLKSDKWMSTQESVFAYLALGKIAKETNSTTVQAELKVNGKIVGTTDGKTITLTSKQIGGNKVEVVTKGTGKLYYTWQSEGIPVNGLAKLEEDNYIKVRKKFYDRFGHVLTSNNFKQNDLIVVGISIENAYTSEVENIVITDILPAGFEIENPRTQEIAGMEWIKNPSQPTYLDVRDDRINYFIDLREKTQTYYYAARAVSIGNFVMGPVMADAMYNGEIHSYSGSGVIKIGGK
jgi:alpha-2-macroglobulin